MPTLTLDGCTLAYDREGSGPPVVFIQGVGLHGAGWLPQVRALRERFDCLTFDNRGMGRSVPAGTKISVERMAADALAIMADAGWESAHLVGHSLGGPVAMQMAWDAPRRVRSLALLCTVARGADATRMTGRMLRLGLRSRIGTRRMRRRAFLEIVMPPDVAAALEVDAAAAELEPLFGHDIADQPPIAMKQLGALRRFDARPRLGQLAGIPTLVVAAAHDPIAPPRFGRELARGIPGARYVEFPDASHGVTIQHAERINLLLREHLQAAEPAISRETATNIEGNP